MSPKIALQISIQRVCNLNALARVQTMRSLICSLWVCIQMFMSVVPTRKRMLLTLEQRTLPVDKDNPTALNLESAHSIWLWTPGGRSEVIKKATRQKLRVLSCAQRHVVSRRFDTTVQIFRTCIQSASTNSRLEQVSWHALLPDSGVCHDLNVHAHAEDTKVNQTLLIDEQNDRTRQEFRVFGSTRQHGWKSKLSSSLHTIQYPGDVHAHSLPNTWRREGWHSWKSYWHGMQLWPIA